jgi:predicted component of type VI protein secretion system
MDGPHMSKLIVTIDGNKADEVPVEYGDITIGRSKDNDIRLNDSTVSAFHAKIVTFFEPTFVDSTFIEDLNSTNGTYINEHRILKRTLRDGDVITIGKYQLVFEFSNDDAATHNNEHTRVLKSAEIEKLLKNASGEKIREIADQSLIPDDVKWVAQDNEGMWWGFSSKPTEAADGWRTDADESMHQLLQSSINDDWKNTLRKL